MTQESQRAVARVQITIEIPLNQPWGADCPISQVWKQARDQAIGILERLRGRDGQGYSIIGEPTVKAIVVEEQKP